MWRRALLLPPAVLALGACSAEQSATPDAPRPPSTDGAVPTTATDAVVTDTSALPTVTTTAPDAPTTTVAPTSTVVETTAVPTTTLPPPSGDPTGDVVPLFAGSDLGPWLFLGRWDGSAWTGPFDADDQPVDPGLASNATLTISDLGRGARDGASGPIGESCFDGRTGPVITPNAGVPSVPGFGYSAIALPADWPLRPRPVVEVEADVPAYVAAGVALFADDAVDAASGRVDQIVVADVDGDGDTESLVVFGSDPGPTAGAGFSGLLLVDADSGAATTIEKSVGQEDPGQEGVFSTFERFRVLDVVDLNGDGLMEIVSRSWYSEGAGVSVATYDGSSVTEVVSTGCGA